MHTIFYNCKTALYFSAVVMKGFTNTVVWFKLVVGNIHEKNFHGKKFSS